MALLADTITRDRAGWYSTPAGRYPSVTKVLHEGLGAPEQLVTWATKVERERCARLAAQAYIDAKCSNLAVPNVAAFMAQRLAGPYENKRIMNEAASKGTAVHAWIESHLGATDAQRAAQAAPDAIPAAIRVPVSAWLRWAERVGFAAQHVEASVWSDREQVAGRVDVIGTVEGRACVVDWKTSTAIRFSHHLQLAWYAQMACERGMLDVPAVHCLRLPWRDGEEYEVWEADGAVLADLVETARAVRRVWQAQQ